MLTVDWLSSLTDFMIKVSIFLRYLSGPRVLTINGYPGNFHRYYNSITTVYHFDAVTMFVSHVPNFVSFLRLVCARMIFE